MNRSSKLLSIFAAAFAFALMFALAGCGQQASSSAAASSATSTSAAASSSAATSASATSASSTANANEVAFTMKVDASNADKGVLYDNKATAAKGTTLYQAILDTGLDLKVNSSGGTVYIDGINGVVASETGPNAGWLFTVNGETPSVGADSLQINDGDTIVWTFYKDYNQAS